MERCRGRRRVLHSVCIAIIQEFVAAHDGGCPIRVKSCPSPSSTSEGDFLRLRPSHSVGGVH